MASEDGTVLASMAELAATANGDEDELQANLAELGWTDVTDRLEIGAGRVDDGWYTRSNAAAYAAYDPDTQTLALVVKGSDGIDDIQDVGDAVADYRDALYRQDRHFELLQPFFQAGLDLIDSRPTDLPVQHLLVTGHSLGGAMVDLFAARNGALADSEGYTIQTASFGSPGVQDEDASGGLVDQHYRVIHTGDPVARLTEVPELDLHPVGEAIAIDLPLIADLDPPDDRDDLDLDDYEDIVRNSEHSPALYALTAGAVLGSELFALRAGDETIRAIINSDSDGDQQDYSWREVSASGQFLVGFGGDDILSAGGGDDLIDGGDGADILFGGTGDDLLTGGDGIDKVYGGEGDDRLLLAGSSRNYAYGGAGSDTLESGADADRLFGGEGRDTFVFRDGDIRAAADILADWDGETLDYRDTEGAARWTVGSPFAFDDGGADDARLIIRGAGGGALIDLILLDLGTDREAVEARLDGHVLI